MDNVRVLYKLLLCIGLILMNGCMPSESKKDLALQYKKQIQQLCITTDTIQVSDSVRLRKKVDAVLLPMLVSSGHLCIAIYDILLANRAYKESSSKNVISDTYYLDAIRILKNNVSPKNIYVWAMVNFGWYSYHGKRDMQQSLNNYYAVIQSLPSIPEEEILDPINTYKRIGYFLGTINETKEAIYYLKKALSYARRSGNDVLTAEISDNIGMYYGSMNKSAYAGFCWNMAMLYACKASDSLRMAKVLGNEADALIRQQQYSKALPLLLNDRHISYKLKDMDNLRFADFMLSNTYMGLKNVIKANFYLEEALSFAQKKPNLRADEFIYLQKKMTLVRQYHLPIDTTPILLRISDLRDAIDDMDGRNALRWVHLSYVNMRNADKKKEIEKVLARTQYHKKIYGLLAILLLGMVFFMVIWYRRKVKRKEVSFDSMLTKLDREKEVSEQKLAQAKKDVASYVVFSNEKKQHIASLEEKLERQKGDIQSVAVSPNLVESVLNTHLLTEESWQHFKCAFIREYPDFYAKVCNEYPGLTESNMRIIFLSKLNLSNIEIANILGVTYYAVKKAKQRLKAKLGMDLTDFLRKTASFKID